MRKFGVVGGLGPLASADVFFKLIKSMPAASDGEHFDAIFEQHPFRGSDAGSETLTQRKLYIFDLLNSFEKRGVTTVVLPCFLSHTFIDELKANSPLQIVDMVEAVRSHVRRKFPAVRRVGVLASDYARRKGLFEKYFAAPEFEVIHPRLAEGVDLVTEAVYGPDGVKSGNLRGRPVELLREACEDLIAQGANVIVPGLTEIALVAEDIGPLRVPLVDSNLVYAQYVVSGQYGSPETIFKVGVVGGVGPAATVDFIHKIVRATPATSRSGPYQADGRAESADSGPHGESDRQRSRPDHLALCDLQEARSGWRGHHRDSVQYRPCLRRAHSTVSRRSHREHADRDGSLSSRDVSRAARRGRAGDLGTIASGVYEKALESQGLRQIVPEPALQARVMEAIYGKEGVKAGFTTGQCQEDIAAAIDGLICRGRRGHHPRMYRIAALASADGLHRAKRRARATDRPDRRACKTVRHVCERGGCASRIPAARSNLNRLIHPN